MPRLSDFLSVLVGVLALGVAAPTDAAPPIRSVSDAVVQLRAPNKTKAAADNVIRACRGSMRHALRDQAPLLKEAVRLARTGSVEAKKAALDLSPCFSVEKFLEVLGVGLADSAPGVVAYAAEAAARVEDPSVVEPLLAALAPRAKACLGDGLDQEAVEVCVWLTYAPGAALGKAARATREKAGEAALGMLASFHPKVREVAVETLASSRLKKYAQPIQALIVQEKDKKHFAKRNEAALLQRFQQRARTLSKSGE